MDLSIEDILCELVIRVQNHFRCEPIVALAAVAKSKLANKLNTQGNGSQLSLDQLANQLYSDLARGM